MKTEEMALGELLERLRMVTQSIGELTTKTLNTSLETLVTLLSICRGSCMLFCCPCIGGNQIKWETGMVFMLILQISAC